VKLFSAPRSPFSIKCRIAIHALSLADRIAIETVNPWADEALRHLNPFCKVPTLELDDGTALYDSRVICEFLDSLCRGRLLPAAGPARWARLRLQALGDGLADAVVRRVQESLGPPTDRSTAMIARQDKAIRAALACLDREIGPADQDLDLGRIAVGAALLYLDARLRELDWRKAHPSLAAFFTEFLRLPPVIAADIDELVASGS
jgi:glutathione S-transferase